LVGGEVAEKNFKVGGQKWPKRAPDTKYA
jgi:hypothetical protein